MTTLPALARVATLSLLAVVAAGLAGCLETTATPADAVMGDAKADMPVEMTPQGPLYACPAPPPRPMVTAPASVAPGIMPGRYLLRGRVVTPDDVYVIGDVLVNDDLIVCVGPDCSHQAEAQ